MRTTTQYPAHYAPIAKQIEDRQLGRAVAVAEWIADLIVAAVNELKAPPRPAWIVIEEVSRKEGGAHYMRFAPR